MVSKKKTQAMLEMGLFGTILLVVIIQLLSYLQRTNEQQYLAMKAFRGALHEAYFNTVMDQGNVVSAGGDVIISKIDHRRHGMGDFFGKGTRAPMSTTAHVYWGVPYIWVTGDPGDTEIFVEQLDHFQLHEINDYKYDLVKYYDTDEDGEDDWKDDDIDGDGTLNKDDDDADGDGLDDDCVRENSGLFDNMDQACGAVYSDSILNWEDDDADGNGVLDDLESPTIEVVMDYREEYTQTQTKTEDSSSIVNTYDLQITDEAKIDFVDREGALTNFRPGAGLQSSPTKCERTTTTDNCLSESTQHHLARQSGQYKYEEGTPTPVMRTITWTTPK